MFNFEINFSFAWLLLLIVPAVVLTLLPYFKLSKRFRKNRNRISSVVLHLTALILCIFVLSGMTFSYEVHNSENELLLVVDASFSTSEEKQAKDEFVRSVIEMTNPDVYSLGIVTFGLQPVCAVPLTDDLRNAYSLYGHHRNGYFGGAAFRQRYAYSSRVCQDSAFERRRGNGRLGGFRSQVNNLLRHAHRQRALRLLDRQG